MTYLAEILTSWTGDGKNTNPNRPQLADDYKLIAWEDCTGQRVENIQPVPNCYSVRATLDETVLAAIEADSKYHVLWSEEVVENAAKSG